jgi:Zn-dependent protease with chaperone function
VSIPYFARLLCLCFAAFFLLHLALSVLVAALATRAIGRAERMRPRTGARFLFGVRMLPAALAGAIVAGLCAPSYLWFEPETAMEHIGLACVAAAAAGVWVCAAGVARGLRAALRSRRYLRVCEAEVESDAPVLMLAGVVRPRLVVSRGTRRALSAEELAVALRHERAHGETHDNLKRLLMLLAPDALPFVRGLGSVERGWRRLAEWAADDRAVRGSRRRALALASALVRIARMGSAPAPALATHLLGDARDLAARVERLLERRTSAPLRPRVWPAVALAACGVAAALQPSTLAYVHEALEALAH